MWEYVVCIWRSRRFWLSLVVNDLQLRYRRSVLGVGWSLLHPLAAALVMGAAFHEIFHRPIREYLPYLLCGLACWSYLTGVACGGCHTYIQSESYIRQHPLPLAVYPLRTVLGLMIHFVIALGLVLVLGVTLRGAAFSPDLASLALGVPVLLLFGWAVTALAGFVNVAFRDTQHILDVVFQILFYLTPIIYPPDSIMSTRLSWVMAFNPLTPFIDLIREPLIGGHPAPAASWAAASLITLTVGLVAAATLAWQQRRVVLYL